jgi:hypothetical protein
MELGLRFLLLLAALAAVLGAWLAPESPFGAAVCWGIAMLFVNWPWHLSRWIGRSWLPRTQSANIVATPPAPAPEAPVRVIFMAHYDTKSQLLPTGIRVVLVMTITGICGVLGLIGLVTALGSPGLFSEGGPWGATMILLLLLTILCGNRTGNHSPGALDNGSGVGTLLELARTWRARPDYPVEVLWVASGSEEVCLDGARHFLHMRRHWWQEKPTLLVNLESVGAGSTVYLSGHGQALQLARLLASDLGFVHSGLHVLGAGMDHEPFAARRLSAVSILGDVVRQSFHLHSRRDNMARIEVSALDRAGALAAHLAWAWPREYQNPASPALLSPSA